PRILSGPPVCVVPAGRNRALRRCTLPSRKPGRAPPGGLGSDPPTRSAARLRARRRRPVPTTPSVPLPLPQHSLCRVTRVAREHGDHTAAARRQRLLERAPRRPAADPLLPFALVVGRIEQQGLIVLEHSERAPVVQR